MTQKAPRRTNSPPKPAPPPLPNEDALALAFADRFSPGFRFDHDSGRWFRWSGEGIGTHWRPDSTRRAFNWCREICREYNPDGKASLGRASTAAGVEKMAQADQRLATTSETWDADPLLLGTFEGTVELETGLLREADRDDYITKITACAPAEKEDCPQWSQFLWEATGGDAEVTRFLKQFCGYALSGLTTEHILLFVYGPGGNGKSVFLNTLASIMADYSATAAFETFAASKYDRHTTDLAMLRGARLVTVSETMEGRAWDETRVKQLTGGDRVSARFMRQDNFTFKPQFKLIIVGNHKPVLKNVDEAMRRRLRLVPFLNKPANPDKDLEQKLRAEFPGILRWMINGFKDWQKHGLISPAAVGRETDAYFENQDSFGQWLAECCQTGTGEAGASKLFESWKGFCDARGEKAGDSKRFSGFMERAGFPKIKRKNGAFYLGISLLNGDG